jgi:hypothetical protein
MSRDDATFNPRRKRVLRRSMVGKVYKAAELATYRPTSNSNIENEMLSTSRISRSGVGRGTISIAAIAITKAKRTTSE